MTRTVVHDRGGRADGGRMTVHGEPGMPPALLVRRQARIADLLGQGDGDDGRGSRWEASGVLALDDGYWVVCDNTPELLRLDVGLRAGLPGNRRHPDPDGGLGYEDLAVDRETGTLFLLVESAPTPDGRLMARVRELDAGLRPVGDHWLDLPLARANKGIEGLTLVRHGGERFLLGLAESTGQVHVFTERPGRAGSWEVLASVPLPSGCGLQDFSGLANRQGRIAVVSQESSALWVGRLDPATWTLLDDGQVFAFPRDDRGRIVYGTVEGVSWVSDHELVVVSDRCKRDQPHRMRATEQSIHLVELPLARGGQGD
jgi:hypothetical protein